MSVKLRLVVCLLGACLSALAGGGVRAGGDVPVVPQFTDDGVVSGDEGHATLSWGPGEDVDPDRSLTYELQQSRDAQFSNHRVRHEGPQTMFFVSGLRDGRTYFRVRAVRSGQTPGPWSAPLIVDVDYPGRRRVVLLLAVGCLVFFSTVATIVIGWRRSRVRDPLAGRAQS